MDEKMVSCRKKMKNTLEQPGQIRCDGVIIAGTTEGRQIMDALNRQGYALAATVATDLGAQVLEGVYGREHTQIFVGRRDEEGFERLFETLAPAFVVDASHPFAAVVTETVRRACLKKKIPYVRFARPEGRMETEIRPDKGRTEFVSAGENNDAELIYARDAKEAADILKKLPGNILFTTGANTASVYVSALKDFNERAYIRVLDTKASVEACRAAGIKDSHIFPQIPPFSVEDNLALIRKYHIRVLVTKDSGRTGGVPQKLESIKRAGILGVVLSRPAENPKTSVSSIDALTEWLSGIKMEKRPDRF